MAFCLKALDNEEDRALFNRALNLLSHGAYAIHEPTEMGEDNKQLFRRILNEFITRFEFALPHIAPATPSTGTGVGTCARPPGSTCIMNDRDKTQLGKTLWGIADDLRGAMNADDFRDYMLSFLFLRYLSDNYEAAAKKNWGGITLGRGRRPPCAARPILVCQQS